MLACECVRARVSIYSFCVLRLPWIRYSHCNLGGVAGLIPTDLEIFSIYIKYWFKSKQTDSIAFKKVVVILME